MLSCLSIDDNEQENLKKCCDEVFGARNFIAQIAWEKVHTRKNSAINFSSSHEYILCYAKVRRNYSGDTVGFKRNLLPRDNGHLYAHHRRYAAWRGGENRRLYGIGHGSQHPGTSRPAGAGPVQGNTVREGGIKEKAGMLAKHPCYI